MRSFYAAKLLRQLQEFLTERYGIALNEAQEVPHIHAFLEHVVERPTLRHYREIVQRPIRSTLVQRIADLRQRLYAMGCSLRLTAVTARYALELQNRYSTGRKGALAAYPEDVARLVDWLDDRRPRHLSLKAATLLIWHTWARPSEILSRYYPDDLDPDHTDGIVIIVPRSKTNPGGRPEHFKILHHENTVLCAICALRQWLEWLGADYRGPLFPALSSKRSVTSVPYSTMKFSQALSRAFVAAGVTRRRYTSYSLRKGQATSAASRCRDLKRVQETLRHEHLAQSVDYIDRDVLFDLMRRTLD
jgi:integrase